MTDKKDKRIDILVVDNSIAVTGALKSILNYAAHLKPEVNFIFVLPQGSLALDLVKSYGFVTLELPFIEIGKSFKKLFLYIPFLFINSYRLKKIIRIYKIHIVHMNDFYNMVGIGAKILGANVSLVTHVRFLPDKFMPALSKVWAKVNLMFADKILCVSEAVKSFFPISNKVEILPDAVPEKENHPVKEVAAVQPKEIKLLYLSNFILGKGQDHALKAFEIAYRKFKHIRLSFVGGDMGLQKNRDFKSSLESIVKSKGLENTVSFLPFASDVENEIKSADILLNFSESESFSLTCLDALFYGTPLIATDCGGPAELFENGKSGCLVPNKDVEAMANAILELASDINKRSRFALEGKKFVRVKYDLNANSLKLKKVYEKLSVLIKS